MTDQDATMKKWWVSFWAKYLPAFEYHGPWWVSGCRDTEEGVEESVCAAVMATDEDAAKAVMLASFDPGYSPTEWRFVNDRDEDWTPFGDRFPRSNWMQWPWPDPEDGKQSLPQPGPTRDLWRVKSRHG